MRARRQACAGVCAAPAGGRAPRAALRGGGGGLAALGWVYFCSWLSAGKLDTLRDSCGRPRRRGGLEGLRSIAAPMPPPPARRPWGPAGAAGPPRGHGWATSLSTGAHLPSPRGRGQAQRRRASAEGDFKQLPRYMCARRGDSSLQSCSGLPAPPSQAAGQLSPAWPGGAGARRDAEVNRDAGWLLRGAG